VVAIATCLIVLSGKSNPDKEDSDDDDDEDDDETDNPKKALRKSIDTLIWVIGLVAYFVISFATGGWYITWVIFPMIGAVQGLVKACMDFKEAPKDEN
jgi:fatty acid desaturase